MTKTIKRRTMYKSFNQNHANVLATFERGMMKTLKEAREELEMPYTELSELAGVSPRALSNMEKEGTMLSTLLCNVLWAEALGFELVLKKK